jgi:hypothetical protein
LAVARDNQAPAEVLEQLDQLPPHTTYATVSEIWAALGHDNESTRW